MFYLVNINNIPFDIEYRLLAENCDYWNGLSLIETRENIDNLQSAPECFPNGEPVSSVGRQKNRETLIGISEWMDIVRESAVKNYMEPNKFKATTVIRKNRQGDLVAFVRENGRLYRHNKLQKAVPNKVTIRTGTLAGAVNAVGTWSINRSEIENKFTGKGRLGISTLLWVRPQTDGYLCRFSFGNRSGSQFLTHRLNHNRKGRPFLEPAVRLNRNVFDVTLYRRVNKPFNQVI